MTGHNPTLGGAPDRPEHPRRAVELTLYVDGHTHRDIRDALYQLAEDIDRGRMPSGSGIYPKAGLSYTLRHDPRMTANNYERLLAQYHQLSLDEVPRAPIAPPIAERDIDAMPEGL